MVLCNDKQRFANLIYCAAGVRVVCRKLAKVVNMVVVAFLLQPPIMKILPISQGASSQPVCFDLLLTTDKLGCYSNKLDYYVCRQSYEWVQSIVATRTETGKEIKDSFEN